MNGADVRAWLDRWREVDERSLRELRELSPEEKFAQLATLMRSASLFQHHERHREEDLRVVERWMLLRERLGNAGRR